MNSESQFEQAALYVSGALTPAEEKSLMSSPAKEEIRAEIDALSEAMAEEILTLPQREAPRALRASLLDKITRVPQLKVIAPYVPSAAELERKPGIVPVVNRAPWALPVAAGLALLAGWGWWERQAAIQSLQEARAEFASSKTDHTDLEKALADSRIKEDRLKDEVALAQKKIAELTTVSPQMAALQKSLEESQAKVKRLTEQNDLNRLQLVALASKITPKASAVVVWDPEGNKGILRVNGLDMQKPNQDYQLWAISPDNPAPVSAGVFKVEKDGSARMVFAPTGQAPGTRTFAISLEKEGGAPAPKGKVVLQGGF